MVLNKDGGLEVMEVQGSLALTVGREEGACVRVALAGAENAGYQFKTHPNIDKALYASSNVLGLKDASRPFPAGAPLGESVGVGVGGSWVAVDWWWWWWWCVEGWKRGEESAPGRGCPPGEAAREALGAGGAKGSKELSPPLGYSPGDRHSSVAELCE